MKGHTHSTKRELKGKQQPRVLHDHPEGPAFGNRVVPASKAKAERYSMKERGDELEDGHEAKERGCQKTEEKAPWFATEGTLGIVTEGKPTNHHLLLRWLNPGSYTPVGPRNTNQSGYGSVSRC